MSLEIISNAQSTSYNSLQSINTTWMTRENVDGSDGSAKFSGRVVMYDNTSCKETQIY